MKSRLHPFIFLLAACCLLTPRVQAQEIDPDLAAALKQSEELTKKNGPMKMPDPKKQLEEIEAEQKQEEQKEKAALQKQLEAPGSVALPDWTPAVPQFHATSSPTRKIVDDEVKIILTGTSPLSPKHLADAWEAAVADKKINHIRNNISSNGDLTTILFLSTRTDPEQKVRMEARRAVGEKISQISISSPLPKPSDESE